MTNRRPLDLKCPSRRRFLALGGMVLVAGCALPGQEAPRRRFRLTPKSTFPDDMPYVAWSLGIDPPSADEAVDTDRIVLINDDSEDRYYDDAQWSDPAPAMVHSLLTESFRISGRVAVDDNRDADAQPDFRLRTVLQDFRAEGAAGAAPRVTVHMTGSLIRLSREEVVGATDLESVADAPGDRIEEVVLAYDEALGAVMKDLVEWALVTGNAAASAG